MARKTPARLVAAAVSGALHLLALLQFFAHKDQYGLPPEWTRDFSLLLGLSLLLLVVIHGMPSLRVRVAAAVVKIVAFLIVGVPFGSFLDIRYILMFSLLLDMSFCFSPPADTILSSAVMAGSVVFLVPISAFSVSMASPRFLDWSSFFFIGASFMLLLSLARRLSERDTENTARIKSLNEFITKLLSTSRDYLEYAARVERESTENERNRITQDLHDVVGQAFTNIYAMMDASLKHPPSSPAETGELHTWAKEQAQKGLNETRAILYQLRSIREKDPSGIAAIKNLVDTFSYSTKVKVHVEWGNLPWETGKVLDEVLYRLVQESLVNAFRHGNASEIQIHFWVGEETLSVDIQDNGRGSLAVKKGIGQESMESRVLAAGGAITFAGSSQGYNVHATFPKILVAAGGLS
jgi:signal transduction histidine kinase